MSTSPPTSRSKTTEDTANSTSDCPRSLFLRHPREITARPPILWGRKVAFRVSGKGGSAPGYLAYDWSALRTFSAITSRRPFTLLGILLALLVIVAFVLVALNASTSGSSPLQTVVVASKDLLPRVPIPADSLSLRSIPVPATYPKVYFASVQQVQGMVPLVTINSGQAVSANDVARPNQALGSQSEYLPIPKGYVALTIPTSYPTLFK